MLLMLFTGTHSEPWQRTKREAGRQRTRRLLDIHINAKLGLCSAAMSHSWSPDRAAWSLRTRSFIFIPAHPHPGPNCHETSQKMSGDVLKMSSHAFWCSKFAEEKKKNVWRWQKFGSHREKEDLTWLDFWKSECEVKGQVRWVNCFLLEVTVNLKQATKTIKIRQFVYQKSLKYKR